MLLLLFSVIIERVVPFFFFSNCGNWFANLVPFVGEKANKETDEVYTQVTLLPLQEVFFLII